MSYGNDGQTFGQILQEFRTNATARTSARENWVKTIQLASKYEAEYRREYAKAIVLAEGKTAAEREAVASAAVAEIRAKRDVARDMKDVWKEDVRGLEGSRANWNTMAKWAQSLEPGIGG